MQAVQSILFMFTTLPSMTTKNLHFLRDEKRLRKLFQRLIPPMQIQTTLFECTNQHKQTIAILRHCSTIAIELWFFDEPFDLHTFMDIKNMLSSFPLVWRLANSDCFQFYGGATFVISWTLLPSEIQNNRFFSVHKSTFNFSSSSNQNIWKSRLYTLIHSNRIAFDMNKLVFFVAHKT